LTFTKRELALGLRAVAGKVLFPCLESNVQNRSNLFAAVQL